MYNFCISLASRLADSEYTRRQTNRHTTLTSTWLPNAPRGNHSHLDPATMSPLVSTATDHTEVAGTRITCLHTSPGAHIQAGKK